MDSDSLQIDFGSVADMRSKLPRARQILEGKEAGLRAQQHDTDWWGSLVAMIESRVGSYGQDAPRPAEPEPASPEVRPATHNANRILDLVVSVVDRESRSIQALDVARILRSEGIDVSNSTVSNSLHYAAKRANPPRIRKMPKRGAYAPLRPSPVAATNSVRELPSMPNGNGSNLTPTAVKRLSG